MNTTRRNALGLGVAGIATHARAVDIVPKISATLLDGTPYGTDTAKGKVLLVNFWATWCGPCREEMPAIEAYYQAHKAQGLEVLALSVDELADEAKVREAAQPFAFRVALQKKAQLVGFTRIWRMPVSAVIDRQGRIVKQDWFVQPKLDAAALDPVILPLLQAS
jgi:thiol-disulfide isomerase/thioredoxin